MSDFEPAFYLGDATGDVVRVSRRQPRGWGGTGESEAPALGEDQSKSLASRVVRGDNRNGTVMKTRALFTMMFQDESDERHVPIHGSVGKMMKNIQFLRDQDYTEEVLLEAWKYFKTQLDHMPLRGSSLWDEFFAHRMEAFKYAANASIGGREGATIESMEDFAKRKMLSQRKERNDGSSGER